MKIPGLLKKPVDHPSVQQSLPIASGNPSPESMPARTKRLHGFSLVEVTLAMGIVSFSLLAVVGLLPVGLKSMQNANELAGASTVVTGISNALRRASPTNATNFTTTFAGQQFGYTMDDTAATPVEWDDLDLTGRSTAAEKRLVARLEITEPPQSNPPRPGRAVVTVAWPAAANPSWNSANGTWSNAKGSMTVGFQFLPRR